MVFDDGVPPALFCCRRSWGTRSALVDLKHGPAGIGFARARSNEERTIPARRASVISKTINDASSGKAVASSARESIRSRSERGQGISISIRQYEFHSSKFDVFFCASMRLAPNFTFHCVNESCLFVRQWWPKWKVTHWRFLRTV